MPSAQEHQEHQDCGAPGARPGLAPPAQKSSTKAKQHCVRTGLCRALRYDGICTVYERFHKLLRCNLRHRRAGPPRGTEEEECPMIAPSSPTVRRRRLAAELRGIRESKGKSGDAVAAALKWSPSKISRYERARTGLQPREVERLLDYYEITGSRRALLLALAQDATQKGWWEQFADALSADYQEFIGLEHEASTIAIWHVDVVTGLLQTEAYARHIISSYSKVEPIAPGMIERLVKVRMQRQRVLSREEQV